MRSEPDTTEIQGHCAPAFQSVREAFSRNFAEHGERGAAVTVRHRGDLVVDLWAGSADGAGRRPWTRDTLAVVFSTTKGLAALCLHILTDRGQIDFEAPVARYWPEFGANGKGDVTVAMVLSHQAGLPVWQSPLPDGALYNWDLAARRLADEAPLWEPGTAHGYHGLTIGWLEGELVRRVTGRTIGAFFHEEVAGPLGADAWIGLPETEHHRVAEMELPAPDPASDFFRKITDEPDWYGAKLVTNDGGDLAGVNRPRRWSMEHPSAGGVANARALAQVYAPLSLDGAHGGVRLVGADRLVGMRTVRSASSRDLILQLPTTFTLGFSKTWGARSLGPGNYVILGEQAFGTPGFGGSLGFADGEAGLAFGYVMNRMGGGVGLNARGQGLVDAAYRAVGYRSSEPGFWVR
ncbi:MAG: beta-lactamase family protein [Alphaproteobacteria bacterium]|nr:beta-lactamase family protein [Alphaproteobacteria bacterium]MBU1512483.1 beta-lactamase family protein [Alphaproteobacteria bacterium]MBU2096593.1 beta-lactamase family protein [Alphaproteobacteria bacterium]MBU2151589.1 beta-lactamase family protein [Alphaproteobacteria bacterium]MBU2307306.1 beta-lactamase family protein [Alphaproteobacteria bacterium]